MPASSIGRSGVSGVSGVSQGKTSHSNHLFDLVDGIAPSSDDASAVNDSHGASQRDILAVSRRRSRALERWELAPGFIPRFRNRVTESEYMAFVARHQRRLWIGALFFGSIGAIGLASFSTTLVVVADMLTFGFLILGLAILGLRSRPDSTFAGNALAVLIVVMALDVLVLFMVGFPPSPIVRSHFMIVFSVVFVAGMPAKVLVAYPVPFALCFALFYADADVGFELGTTLVVCSALWGIGILIFDMDTTNRRTFIYHQAMDSNLDILASEIKKSDSLLCNILPERLASIIRTGKSNLVSFHSTTTVFFLDIVQFTALSSSRSPEQVVRLLNRLFSICDSLLEQHLMEKIHTIGDAYLAVCGVPDQVPDHALQTLAFAKAVLRELERTASRNNDLSDVKVRIGLASGPAISSVLGDQRYSYNIFGPTLEKAVRAESTGTPMQVHIDGSTVEAIRRTAGDRVLSQLGLFDLGDGTYADSSARQAPMSSSAGDLPMRNNSMQSIVSAGSSSTPAQTRRARRGSVTVAYNGRRNSVVPGLQLGSVSEFGDPESADDSPSAEPVVIELDVESTPRSSDAPPPVPLSARGGPMMLPVPAASTRRSWRSTAGDSVDDSVAGTHDASLSAVSSPRVMPSPRDLQVPNTVSDPYKPEAKYAVAATDLDATIRSRVMSLGSEESLLGLLSARHDGSDAKLAREINPVLAQFRDSSVERSFRLEYLLGTKRPNLFRSLCATLLAMVLTLIADAVDHPLVPGPGDAHKGAFAALMVVRGVSVALVLAFIGLFVVGDRRNNAQICRMAVALTVLSFVAAQLASLMVTYTPKTLRGLSEADMDLMMDQVGVVQITALIFIVGVLPVPLVPTLGCVAILSTVSVAWFVHVELGNLRIMIMETLLIPVSLCLLAKHQSSYMGRVTFWRRRQSQALAKLARTERDKARTLLLNIMPAHIYAELQSEKRRGLITDPAPEATIMFVRIDGLAAVDAFGEDQQSLRKALDSLVLLGELLQLIDDVVLSLGLEKIKLTGSPLMYIAAGGIAMDKEQEMQLGKHGAIQMTRAALNICAVIAAEMPQLRFKVGLHSGPVTCGIVGRTRICYDVHGDTVNISQRICNTGSHGQVLMSDKTRDLIERGDDLFFDIDFELSDLGEFDLKGAGSKRLHSARLLDKINL